MCQLRTLLFYQEEGYLYYLKTVEFRLWEIAQADERFCFHKYPEEEREKIKKERRLSLYQMLISRVEYLRTLLQPLLKEVAEQKTSVTEAPVKETQFKEGELDGEQKYFYSNGSLKSLLNYEGGVLHGKTTFFYPNGQKKREQTFEKGFRQGYDRFWYETGQIWMEVLYAHDVSISKAMSWYPNGNIEIEIELDPTGNVTMRRISNEQGQVVEMIGMEKQMVDQLEQLEKVSLGLQTLHQELIQKLELLGEFSQKSKSPPPSEILEQIEKSKELLEEIKGKK